MNRHPKQSHEMSDSMYIYIYNRQQTVLSHLPPNRLFHHSNIDRWYIHTYIHTYRYCVEDEEDFQIRRCTDRHGDGTSGCACRTASTGGGRHLQRRISDTMPAVV